MTLIPIILWFPWPVLSWERWKKKPDLSTKYLMLSWLRYCWVRFFFLTEYPTFFYVNCWKWMISDNSDHLRSTYCVPSSFRTFSALLLEPYNPLDVCTVSVPALSLKDSPEQSSICLHHAVSCLFTSRLKLHKNYESVLIPGRRIMSKV